MPINEDDPLEQQQSLAESSLALLFETYDAAVKDKVEQPVVILLDCEDEIGGEIARAWLGDDAVDDAIANNTAENQDSEATVYARSAPWKVCRAEVGQMFEYLAPVFEESPPADGFMVISVTAGGASALTVPMDARE